MKKIEGQYGNKEREVDMKVILDLAQIPTFNKAKGVDFIGRMH